MIDRQTSSQAYLIRGSTVPKRVRVVGVDPRIKSGEDEFWRIVKPVPQIYRSSLA
jgi:hypothetical protein